MNELEQRKRNRRIAIRLCLLFTGLFIIATLGFVTGVETHPFIEKIVAGITTPILGIIGLLLIIAAVVEIVVRFTTRRAR